MNDNLKQREQELEAEALRINAGRKPKFGDLMRNPWASESNPIRDGYFVRKCGAGFNAYYEFTNGNGKFWKTRARFAFFIEAARATPAANNLISLDAALACVPGGTICDPQQVADAIRAVPIVCATPAQPAPEKHPLFYRKLADLQQRGYQVFGHILHKNGEYALFDDSCRWLTQPQYWRLMHEQDGSLFATPSPASDVSAPSPSSVGAAIRALPLPEPLEIDWPQLHSVALGCGVEDRNIRDRYEAAEYGWQDGVDKAAERVPDDIYTADQVRELLSKAAALASQAQQPEGWKVVPRKMTDEQAREVVCNINRKYKVVGPISDFLVRAIWEWGIYASPAAPSIAQDGQKSEGA